MNLSERVCAKEWPTGLSALQTLALVFGCSLRKVDAGFRGYRVGIYFHARGNCIEQDLLAASLSADPDSRCPGRLRIDGHHMAEDEPVRISKTDPYLEEQIHVIVD